MMDVIKPMGPAGGFPRGLTAAMRAELPGVAEEIITELRRVIPEYAGPLEGPYGQALRRGVQEALTTFVDRVADPSAPCQARDETCRWLGQQEAFEGRSLDSLQAAYRVGAQVAWRRMMKLGQRHSLDAGVMSRLADSVFRYVDELAALSVEGYQAARSRSGDARAERRRRLLRLLVEQPPAPRREVTSLAGLAGWALPEIVTAVAVGGADGSPRPGEVPAAGEDRAGLLDEDILADLGCDQPYLLVPGEVTEERERALREAVAGRVVIGVAVPLAAAVDSLRWARRVLWLAEAGVISTGAPVIRCEEHLVTVWLWSDPGLAAQIARRELGVLEPLTELQRDRYTQTLGAWLETRCTAAEIAQRLGVHPQTIRYRIRQFEQAFGDRLKDPDARFGLELALRIARLDQQTPRQAGKAGRAPTQAG